MACRGAVALILLFLGVAFSALPDLLQSPTSRTSSYVTAVAKHPTADIWFLGLQGGIVAHFKSTPSSSLTEINQANVKVLHDYTKPTDQADIPYRDPNLPNATRADYAAIKIILDSESGLGFVLESGYMTAYGLPPDFKQCEGELVESNEELCRENPPFLANGFYPFHSRVWSFNYTRVTSTSSSQDLDWRLLWDGYNSAPINWKLGVAATMEYDPTYRRLWVFVYGHVMTIDVVSGLISQFQPLVDDKNKFVYINAVCKSSTDIFFMGFSGWFFATPKANFQLEPSFFRRSNFGQYTLGSCVTYEYASGREGVFAANWKGNVYEIDTSSLMIKRLYQVGSDIYSLTIDPNAKLLLVGGFTSVKKIPIVPETAPLVAKDAIHTVPCPVRMGILAFDPSSATTYAFTNDYRSSCGVGLQTSLVLSIQITDCYYNSLVLPDCEACRVYDETVCGVCLTTGACWDGRERSSTATSDWHIGCTNNTFVRNDNTYTCPKTLQLQPSQAPVAGNTIVTVVGTNFPSEYSYECRFRQLGSMSSSGYYTNENKYVTVPAIYNDSTILLCPTPSWDNQGQAEQVGQLDIFVTQPFNRIWDDLKHHFVFPPRVEYYPNPRTTFTFYDCTKFSSCSDCISPNRPECAWCTTSTGVGCAQKSSCSGDYSTVCPAILSVSEPSLPKYGGINITLTLSHLPPDSLGLELECAFEVGSSTYYSTAYISSGQVICSVPDVSATFPSGTFQYSNAPLSLKFNGKSVTYTQSTSLISFHDCALTTRCDLCSSYAGCQYCVSTGTVQCQQIGDTCAGTLTSDCPSFLQPQPHRIGTPLVHINGEFSLLNANNIPVSCFYKDADYLSAATVVNESLITCPLAPSITSPDDAVAMFIVAGNNKNDHISQELYLDAYDCNVEQACAVCLAPSRPECQWCDEPQSTCVGIDSTCSATAIKNFTQCSYIESVNPSGSSHLLGVSSIRFTGNFQTKSDRTYTCQFVDSIDTIVNGSTVRFISSTLAECDQPFQETGLELGTGTVQLLENGAPFTNAVPFTFYDCTEFSSCDSCTAAQHAGCSWCGLTCMSARICGHTIRSCPALSSISRDSMHTRGGDVLTITGGPFLPYTGGVSHYQCRWRSVGKSGYALTEAQPAGIDAGHDYTTRLRCTTPAWPQAPDSLILDVLYDGYLLTTDYFNITAFECASTGSICADSCFAQPYCGWCAQEGKCTDNVGGCSGLWAGEKCLSSFTYQSHAAALKYDQNQTIVFSGSIHNIENGSDSFECVYGSQREKAVFTAPNMFTCRIPLSIESSVSFELRQVLDNPQESLPLISSSFTYVDCGKYTTCGDCIQGSEFCGWCTDTNKCTTSGECPSGLCLDSGRTSCPAITSISPASVNAGEEVPLTISGRCFTSNSHLVLSIGDIVDMPFTWVNSSILTTVSPHDQQSGEAVVALFYRADNNELEPVTTQNGILTISTSGLLDAGAIAAVGVVIPLVVLAVAGVIIFIILRRRRGGLKVKLVEPDYVAVAFASDREPKYKSSGDLSLLERELKRPDYAWQLLLDKVVGATEQDDVAKAFVYLSYEANTAVGCIVAVIRNEISACEFENTIFRGNSMASKMFKFYSRMIGIKYLFGCLARFLAELAALSASDAEKDADGSLLAMEMEVDPDKVEGEFDKDTNTMQLILVCQKILSKIMNSINKIPKEFRQIFHEIDNAVMQKFSSPDASCKAIGGLFFLRYVCPSITTPHAYGLLPRPPNEALQRQVVLISKVLQSLANLTVPGKKEEYMASVNEFIETNIPKMEKFYDTLRHQPPPDAPVASDISVPSIVRDNSLCAVWLQMLTQKSKIDKEIDSMEDKTKAGELHSAFEAMAKEHPEKPTKIKRKK